jgi:hypothetical protein
MAEHPTSTLTLAEVKAMSEEDLNALMGLCLVEPAVWDGSCMACLAYLEQCVRESDDPILWRLAVEAGLRTDEEALNFVAGVIIEEVPKPPRAPMPDLGWDTYDDAWQDGWTEGYKAALERE